MIRSETMSDKFFSISIHEFEGKEDIFQKIISSFSCLSQDVEYFLKNTSVMSAKKRQTVSYLVFHEDTSEFVGYYTLAIKPISILSEGMSNTLKKKLERVAIYNEKLGTYNAASYLIAQFGKNSSLSSENAIPGEKLLQIAEKTILEVQSSIGGIIEFLESEDVEKLLEFYGENGFVKFGERMTEANAHSESHKLHLMYKLI